MRLLSEVYLNMAGHHARAHPQGYGTTGTLTPDRPEGPHYLVDVLGALRKDHQD